MCWRLPSVPVHGPPDPVLVHYSGIGASVAPVTYIVCLHGRVPKRYELWSLNEEGVCEVHPFARIWLLDDLRADTFQTNFFNLRRCRIPFIGRRSLNGSVKFIEFADVTSDSTKSIIYTPNIFVHGRGTSLSLEVTVTSRFCTTGYVKKSGHYWTVNLEIDHGASKSAYRSITSHT